MGRHMQSHMPDELKKYKCDICSKGFPTNQHFKDHKNIHTGEKGDAFSPRNYTSLWFLPILSQELYFFLVCTYSLPGTILLKK